jgi:hypothetical protein
MLFREIIYVYSENHKKSINTLRKQNAELLTVKTAGKYSYHFVLKQCNRTLNRTDNKCILRVVMNMCF